MAQRWTAVDYTVMTHPHITITVPKNLTADFIGIIVLDILHDATGKGRGAALANRKLSEITDLLAETILITMPDVNIDIVKDYFFHCTLLYFLEIWANNLPALGLDAIPIDKNLQDLKESVMVPVRRTMDRYGHLTCNTLLYSVKDNEMTGVEAYNYHYQKSLLNKGKVYECAFESPEMKRKDASVFFNKPQGIVDIINYNYPNSQIVLDMKHNGGLLRFITDPITYITSLATYSDPGYNMNMSAIRNNSTIDFLRSTETGFFNGTSEFTYAINLETPLSDEPLPFLYTRYFNGVCTDGLDRSNVSISTLGETFVGVLPSASDMSSALCSFLQEDANVMSTTVGEVLYDLQNHIYNYYNAHSPPFNIEGLETDNFEENYLSATLKNIQLYDLEIDVESADATFMITHVLPDILSTCIQEFDIKLLGFVNSQYKLLQEYAVQEPRIAELLKNQWLPKRSAHHRCKLVNKLKEQVTAWRMPSNIILEDSLYLKNYMKALITACTDNIHLIESDEILDYIPIFNPSRKIMQILEEHLLFYNPEMYWRTKGMNRTVLLLSTVLSVLMWEKPLLNLDINLDSEITYNTVDHEAVKHEALRMILGKFSGDFGQIMWSMHEGHLFASGDNNASAMALLMHRIDTPHKWGSIHEAGNGGCVYVTLEKTWS